MFMLENTVCGVWAPIITVMNISMILFSCDMRPDPDTNMLIRQ